MPRGQLKRLINTLTDGEIKFFRQYARRHVSNGEATYLKLFDLMLKEKNDNEDLILNKLKGKLSRESYESLKKYLYELILKTLVILKEETSLHAEMLRELSAAEVLADKQLFEDAFKKLSKIQSATKNNELFCLGLAAAWLEETIMRSTGYTLTTTKEITARNAKLKNLVNQFQAQTALGSLFAAYCSVNRSGMVRGEQEKYLQDIFNNPLLNDDQAYPLTSSRRSYYIMKVVKARYEGNKDLAKSYIQKIYSIVKEYPLNFSYHEYLFIITHYMMMLSCMESGEFKKVAALLRKMKAIKSGSKRTSYTVFRLAFPVELMLLKSQNKHEECLSLIMNYESQVKSMRGTSFNILEYRNYQVIIGYLLSRKLFTEALPFINGILNDRTTKERGMTYQIYARIMNLIVHFELKNFDLVESDIRGLDYFVRKNHVQFKFIRHMLQFFKTIINSRNHFEESINELGAALLPLTEIPAERIYMYDVIESGWLQQKGLQIRLPSVRPMVM